MFKVPILFIGPIVLYSCKDIIKIDCRLFKFGIAVARARPFPEKNFVTN
jgi:hypothetical protein